MLNTVSLMGRMVAEPVLRTIHGEDKDVFIARYRLAVERDYKKGDSRVVDFIACKAFGAEARFAKEYYHQGDLIVVNGRIFSEPYEKPGEEKPSMFTGVQVRKSYLAKRKGTDSARTRVMDPVQDGKAVIDEEEFTDWPPLPEEEEFSEMFPDVEPAVK